ncbi:glycosyltransferase [Stappia sp. F7233]|uniref:Glycosyltransferase n=1 Tax=Stappia albiluteola TaxID=2758565 RepID=A0A839ACK6_9HYPH|nr:glycosyltransferase [Stappia albiluteola]MBA5776399.1 glycosyltransferase [Stappia albiluteola]
MSFKAFIHVQHLLGTGHAVRAAAIGRALAERGVEVTLATGNRLPPMLATDGLKIVELPAVRTLDAHFNRFVTPDGKEVDDDWRAARQKATLKAFLADDYDLLLTETFPFGRRPFAFELEPLVEAAKDRDRAPLIATSIRDILVRKQELWKEEWMAERAERFYDRILIHSDPEFVRLEDSFPFADRVASLVRYTGFVNGEAKEEAPDGIGEDEVIVSCGGGAVGLSLLRAAIDAASLSRRAGDTAWRLLVGHDIDGDTFEDLRRNLPENVIVERARPDFPALLPRARASISQAGYNTVLDILVSGVPCVLVPFAQVRETEQQQRAEALAARGRATIVPERGLSPERLAAALDDALAAPRRHFAVRLGGAQASADILIADLQERFGR